MRNIFLFLLPIFFALFFFGFTTKIEAQYCNEYGCSDADATGQITASPNPCDITASGQTCTSRITWSSVDAPAAWVEVRGQQFPVGTVFAPRGTPNGVQDAPWIDTSGVTFYLRPGDGSGRILAQVTVTARFVAPQAPQITQVDPSCSQVRIRWNKVPGGTQYHLYRNGNYFASTGDADEYIDTVPLEGQDVNYQVQAQGQGGYSNLSGVVGTRLPTCPPGSANASGGCRNGSPIIDVSWSPSSYVSYYAVQRTDGRINYVSRNSFTDSDIQNGANYAYLIYAITPKGQWVQAERWSQWAQGFCPPPREPSPLSGDWSCRSENVPLVTLNWRDVTGEDFYEIHKLEVRSGREYLYQTVGRDVTTFQDGNVDYRGDSYFYRVRAVSNQFGASPFTNYTGPLSPDCRGPEPPRPVSATAVCASNLPQNNLTFEPSANADLYYIWRSPRWSDGETHRVNPSSYEDRQDLVPNNTYNYTLMTVRVLRGGGWSVRFAPFPNPVVARDCQPVCGNPVASADSASHQGGTVTFTDTNYSQNQPLVERWDWTITRNGNPIASNSTSDGRFRWGPIPVLNGRYVLSLRMRGFTSGVAVSCPNPLTIDMSDLLIQTTDGDVHSNGQIGSETSLFSGTGQYNADYLVTSASDAGERRFGNFTSRNNNKAQASSGTPDGGGPLRIGARYDYNYFASKLPITRTIDLGGGSATLEASSGGSANVQINGIALNNNGVYRITNGNLTLNNPARYQPNIKLVLLIEGDLIISADFASSGANSSYYAFVTRGHVTVAPQVNRVNAFIVSSSELQTYTAANVANNTFDSQLVVNGSLISYSGFDFQRRSASGASIQVNYDPGYLINLPLLLGVNQSSWQEIAP